MSEQIPRPEATPSRPLTPSRRLALHIPNIYPRATSPRSSPMGSPLPGAAKTATEEQAQDGDSTRAELAPQLYGSTLTTAARAPTPPSVPADERTSLQSGAQRRSWWQYLRSETTSGESSRDFLGVSSSSVVEQSSKRLTCRLRLPLQRGRGPTLAGCAWRHCSPLQRWPCSCDFACAPFHTATAHHFKNVRLTLWRMVVNS